MCRYQLVEADEGLLQEEKKNNHLLFILTGELEVVYGSLKPRNISAGTMIFLPLAANCSCRTMAQTEILEIEFNELSIGCDKYLFQHLAPIYSLIKYEFQELEIREPLSLYIELLQEYLRTGILTKELLMEKIKELIILLRAFYNAEELTMLFYPLLGKNMDFKKLIIDNYLKVRNASEYAQLCGYSLGVFQRKFKEVFGETVYQWMQRQKAEQIKHRLMITDTNPKELAEEFDFASPAHLNKFCKVWFGMTPSELRQTYLLKKNLK